MASRAALAVGVSLVVAAAVGCSSGSPALVLDGSPRYPNIQGVVAKVAGDRLVFDDGRSYRLDPNLNSFSTYSLVTLPVIQVQGRYVEGRAQGDSIRWIETVAAVTHPPGGTAIA